MDDAMQMEELVAEGQRASISVTVVTEFVTWNEEAISRCKLFTPQVNIDANKSTCLNKSTDLQGNQRL